MKKHILIIGLLLMNFFNGFAQQKDSSLISNKKIKQENNDMNIAYIIGIKNFNTIEFGVAKPFKNPEKYNLFYPNIHLSPEISFANSNVVLATKVGFTATYVIINFGTQLIHFTDFKNNDFAIRPEIGISVLGILDLAYGYNIQLYQKQIQSISNNNITLRFTTPQW